MSDDAEKLNPLIERAEIGIRQLRRIDIYPLSIADQKKMTKSITDTLTAYFAGGDLDTVGEIEFIDFLVKTILENLIEFLRLVTDFTKRKDAESLLEDMTNDQAVNIAQIIYSQNYEGALKNAMSLLDKIKLTFQSKRPLPLSAKDMDTDLNTSTDLASETEELPMGS